MTSAGSGSSGEADTFGAVASVALERACDEVRTEAVMLDLEEHGRRPVLAVVNDHLDVASVRGYLAGGFRDDRLRAHARLTLAPALSSTLLGRRDAREHAAVIGCRDAVCFHIALVPVIGAGRSLGTLRVASERPLPDDVGARLMALSTDLSVRLTRLGFGGPGEGSVRLTGRQREVARLVSRGFTNAAIARQLGVTEDGIKKHVKVMMEALDVANRAELAVVVARSLAGPDGIDDRQLGPRLQLVRWSPSAREA